MCASGGVVGEQAERFDRDHVVVAQLAAQCDREIDVLGLVQLQ